MFSHKPAKKIVESPEIIKAVDLVLAEGRGLLLYQDFIGELATFVKLLMANLLLGSVESKFYIVGREVNRYIRDIEVCSFLVNLDSAKLN